jgi:hypothetical protein
MAMMWLTVLKCLLNVQPADCEAHMRMRKSCLDSLVVVMI